MIAAMDDAKLNALTWWASQRTRYNVVLIGSIVASVLSMTALRGIYEGHFLCDNITAVSLLIITVICLVGVGVANICYFLGPISEKLIRPRKVDLYRRCAFWIGAVFSVLVASSLVLSGTLAALRDPPRAALHDRMDGKKCD